MNDTLRISAKNLGRFALPDFCEYCFWLWLKASQHLPYQSFPGVFNNLDRGIKTFVHAFIDEYKVAPPHLGFFCDAIGYIEPFRLKLEDAKLGTILTGEPDALLIAPDGNLYLLDYKVAKHTKKQDQFFGQYEVQLNGYAYLLEKLGYLPVNEAGLIYFEPDYSDPAAVVDEMVTKNYVPFPFKVDDVRINLKPNIVIPPLLKRARKLYDMNMPPKSREGCKNCELLSSLIAAAGATKMTDSLNMPLIIAGALKLAENTQGRWEM